MSTKERKQIEAVKWKLEYEDDLEAVMTYAFEHTIIVIRKKVIDQ